MATQGQPGTPGQVVSLAAAAGMGPERAGSKAFNLGRLAAAGLPVPAGFVVTPEAFEAWEVAGPAVAAATGRLGADRYAVRSSAVAEDLPGASYAGMYDTVLNVAPAGVAAAVRKVWDSASAGRVAAYRQGRGGAAGPPQFTRMAVLVQAMVEAEAAGVAFTADPLTGERGEVVITAVRGLGERLVGGEAVGDEWVVRAGRARCRRSAEGAIGPGGAREVAQLARRAEAHFGSPQDVEWAITGGRVVLLQARPMTALPGPVTWSPPGRGWWIRNFRLGEWLPDPVTPLFEHWLLPVLERGVARAMRAESGIAMRPDGGVVNGWYYTTPQPRVEGSLPLQLFWHPKALLLAPRVVMLVLHPERMPRELATMARQWREELLPRYRQTRQFTLGWPVLRRCALRLGEELTRRGAIARPGDVFFLTRNELESALGGAPLPSPPKTVTERRERWEGQRRLAAPLQLGKAPAAGARVYARAIEVSRTRAHPPEGALAGEPASPGRATGPVHVILDPGDFAGFQPGEVLVTRATAPAWTPLFAKAAAVVTDGGTLAAHASLVAREFGIPAVVATANATARLRDGQVVTVDGGADVVEIHA